MLTVNYSYFQKTLAVSIITLIVFWLISMWNINIWQQVLFEKTAENKPTEELQESMQKKAMLLNTQLKKTLTDKVESLVLTNVALPDLPQKTIDIMTKNTNTFQPSVKKSKQAFAKTQTNVTDKQPIKIVNKRVTKESTSAIYQQLISDTSISIELAWPNESSARQGLFTFLYQCIGMKFGVLNNHKVTLAKTFYQKSNNVQQPSEWLRIAQGKLASQERLWLQQYNLSGTPVRLFPKVVDWHLAKLISNQLNDTQLKSLRAHYKYEHQRLVLQNIRLNGQLLNKSWTLIENKCSI